MGVVSRVCTVFAFRMGRERSQRYNAKARQSSLKRQKNNANQNENTIEDNQNPLETVFEGDEMASRMMEGMSRKKRKRLEKFIQQKLKKEERVELVQQLNKSSMESTVLQSSKHIGRSKKTTRERIRQAFLAEQHGLEHFKDATVKLVEERTVNHSTLPAAVLSTKIGSALKSSTVANLRPNTSSSSSSESDSDDEYDPFTTSKKQRTVEDDPGKVSESKSQPVVDGGVSNVSKPSAFKIQTTVECGACDITDSKSQREIADCERKDVQSPSEPPLCIETECNNPINRCNEAPVTKFTPKEDSDQPSKKVSLKLIHSNPHFVGLFRFHQAD